jgi:hypothetical protein
MNVVEELTRLRDRLNFSCMTTDADRVEAIIKHLDLPSRNNGQRIFAKDTVEFASIELDDVFHRRGLSNGEVIGLNILVASTLLSVSDSEIRVPIAQEGAKALYGARWLPGLLQLCGVEMVQR